MFVQLVAVASLVQPELAVTADTEVLLFSFSALCSADGRLQGL